MDKAFDPSFWEKNIYKKWEDSGSFKASGEKQPYTILMPPPNANASLHAGHAMYTIDDIVIRFKRMCGYKALWIPGMDHAGFETQFVYEKHLAKEGKSRMDFDRQTLYDNIFKFVRDNSGLIYSQFKRLGFSADWDRSVFMLDEKVIDLVYGTFQKMYDEKLIYRDDYIVNYCVNCGTSLAELEVVHTERTDSLYYLKYPIKGNDGFLTVATVRPETMFGDSAVAVNPKDKRYKRLIGKTLLLPLTSREIPVIADEMVDMEFGTGAVKITPAHDPNDFLVGKRFNLENIQVINLRGKMVLPPDSTFKDIEGIKAKSARDLVVAELTKLGLVDKIDENYSHAVTSCYKCKKDLEPTILPNWFIKVDSLKQKVIKAVESNEIKFTPIRYKKHMLNWLDIMHDWPISRQIAWGIRIPAWYDTNKNPDLHVVFLDKDKNIISGNLSEILKNHKFEEIEQGLQSLSAPKGANVVIASKKPKGFFLQETDTFDTWFSSGQWPVTTLQNKEYKDLLPTDFLGTLSDILKFWVSRMIMFSLYIKEEIPFKNVYLWSMVADSKGVKMSKSKGNVVNPIDLVDKYGADALRFSLIFGTPAGSKVILSDDKVRGMRNFANKVWNIGRYLKIILEENNSPFLLDDLKENKKDLHPEDKDIIEKYNQTKSSVTDNLDKFRFSQAADDLYKFIWDDLASIYLEQTKERKENIRNLVLVSIYLSSLKLLHPFMPYVTEAVWQSFSNITGGESLLIKSSWPKDL